MYPRSFAKAKLSPFRFAVANLTKGTKVAGTAKAPIEGFLGRKRL